MKSFFRFILSLLGWKIVGELPVHEKKYLIIVAPHTSNWDFLIGVLVRGAMGFDSKFLGKKSLFKKPYGWFFRLMGGYPVDRSKSTNLVDQVVNLYNEHERFVLSIAPEGTRQNVNEWKTGFYYIAYAARIPLVRARIDRGSKEVRFYKPFIVSGNIEKDLPKIKEVYS